MLCCEEEGLSSTIPRVIEGLRALGIEPGGTESSSNISVPSAPGHISEKVLHISPSTGGERKQVTVLCASVSVPPSLSEEMDPEGVNDLLGPVVDIMIEEVHRYEGTIAQLSGDGLTAIFGAPLAHEDDPQRALYAVQSIKRRLSEYEKRLKPKGMELTLRAGANTGLIKVEGVGEDLSMSYTPLGDTVNLASQLKSAAGPGEIMVSETTLRLAEGYFEFAQVGGVEAEGKKQPTWILAGPGPARTRIAASLARGLTPFVGT